MTTPQEERTAGQTLNEIPPLVRVPCEVCWGAGEWDEGPINGGGGAPVDPIYRQVICPECDGLGWIVVEDGGDCDD